MVALTFTMADIGNTLVKIWTLLSPFVILVLGWNYTARQKKEERKHAERDKERERMEAKVKEVKKDVEQIHDSISDVQNKFQKLAEELEDDDSIEQVNEILDITQGLLFYSIQMGTLVLNIADFIKVHHELSDSDMAVFTKELEQVRQKEQALQELIYRINRRGVTKK